LTLDEQRRMRAFRGNLLENLDGGPLAPPVYLIPGIKPKRFFDPGSFAGVAELEAALDDVRDEFLALAERNRHQLGSRLTGLHGDRGGSGNCGRWSMIPLIRNGRRVEEYAGQCPRTMELAKALPLPQLSLISPSVYFSVLEPGSRIAPHTGITNARLIAHFPLIVPDDCGLAVGGETRRWQAGKALVFDDMTEHEAWNDSDSIRVVLIVDLWRPELSPVERRTVSELMACPPADVAA
jgi:aspartyl/asparaginyl beta-hydroxylase (cupin superfamily)